MKIFFAALALVALAGAGCSQPVAESPPEKLRVLIVDGFSNHDWQKTTGFIEEVLDRSGKFEVDVSTSPASVDAEGWDEWNPRFSDYAVVIQNSNNIQEPELRWPRRVEQDLEEYLRGGGGMLAYHSANNAFAHWSEYDAMIALGWRPKEYGTALQMDAEGGIRPVPPGQGEGTSHGPRQDTVVIRKGEHPVNRGMPQRWLTPDIEVYTHARGPAENVTVLSYGRHHASDTYWPLEWTVQYGQGRVYASSFGHIWRNDDGIPDRVLCAGFQTSLIRATEWLATGDTTYAVPDDFPSEDQVRLRAR